LSVDGDVDLTTEYFDPHAVAGLLKTYFRELPVHIFTLELNQEFIKANEIMDRAGKVREVTNLVQQLPVANYSALRFLSAHLVKIVNKETINKMSVKNLGIVFSPTLPIPASK
jgi:RalA-binding protein 1